MTSQDDRRTMEAMLASIREAIHRETALQMAGLHKAGDRVVVDHEPVSRPVEPAAVDGAETSPPDYLRPLKDAAEEDLISSSAETGEGGPSSAGSGEGLASSDAEASGAEAEPLRLAAGAETSTDAPSSIEDLFEPEKANRPGGVQARQHESLFEDILAGRRSVGRIEPDRSAEVVGGRGSHGGGAWHEPARRAVEAAPDAPSSATNAAEEEARKGSAVFDLQDLGEEAMPSEDGPVAEDGDPLNEIDLDDDIIWTVPEAEAPAQESCQAGAAAPSSAGVTEAADEGEAAAEAMEEAALVAPDVAERVAEAFGRLDAEMMLSALGGSAALERIVRQEMRPLLREWLNAHLPALVERIIREEIQRIIHGGRTPRSL